jgi:TolB-like protein/Tfp pilus assembly protein PilF
VNERPPESSARRPADEPSDRLDSWKDVAAYLKRDVSTVQRWERREGLPVHRHLHDKLGSVYAFRSELDVWSRSRRLRHGQTNDRVTETEAASSSSGSPENERSRWARQWVMAAGLTTLAVIAIVYGVYRSRVASAPGAEIRSLAVLPLENLSGDPAQEFFAAGMTEELIGSLAQIRALRVVSRTSAMSLKGSAKSLPVIARELNVDAVLEGSVQQSDGRVKIRLQLLHAPTDTHLWAREYERELTDVLRLQSEVAREVAKQIRIQITPEERVRMASVSAVNPAAHEQYLLGRYLLWKFIEEDRMRAVDHFNRAVQIDPTYAAPYAGLAHAWWMRGVLGPLSLKEVAPESRAAARKALELDDGLAEAYAAQAYVEGMFDWDWTGAERTIRHAVELDTNSLDARYVYALLLMALGRLPEAVTQIEHAAQLDPLSAQVHSTFGRILYRARKFDEAIVHLNRAIELEPRNAVAWRRLGDVHDQMGKYAEALACHQKAQALLTNPRNGDSEGIARVYAHMGMVSEARQMLKRLGNRSPAVYAALGEKDTAFRLLFMSVDQRINWSLFINSDPSFDSLHSDPRWKELLRRMNLPIDSGVHGSR